MISKLWYLLTAYVPRRLPATPEEYLHFKAVLVDCYGVTNEPPYWALVAGQICSTPASSLRKAWGDIANAAKRIDINNLAQMDRKTAMEALNQKLEAATNKAANQQKVLAQILHDFPNAGDGALNGNETARRILITQLREKLGEEVADATDEQCWKFIMSVLVENHVKELQGKYNEQEGKKQPKTDAGTQSEPSQDSPKIENVPQPSDEIGSGEPGYREGEGDC